MKSCEYLGKVKAKLSKVGTLTTRAMMGGYLVYVNGVYCAIVDDDTLYVKKFAENAEFFADCPQKPPYDGAKPMYMPDISDDDYIAEGIELTFIGAANNKSRGKKQ